MKMQRSGMSYSDAGRLGGSSYHYCRGQGCAHKSHMNGYDHKKWDYMDGYDHKNWGYMDGYMNGYDGRKMSRSEAARAGGIAPHVCRGRQCSQMYDGYRSPRSPRYTRRYPSSSM